VPTIAISQSNETGGSPTTDARKQIKNDGYPSADRRITNAGAPTKIQSPRRLTWSAQPSPQPKPVPRG
jgi:hypothetical protein